MDEQSERCVLATHIGRGWETGEAFPGRWDRLIDEGSYDELIYASSPKRKDRMYDRIADTTFETVAHFGYLDDEAVDYILDQYDSIVHIGAFWGKCHAQTWKSLLSGVNRRETGEYEIIFPLSCIAEDPFCHYSSMDDVPGVYDEFIGRRARVKTKYSVEGNPDERVVWRVKTLD